MLELKAVDGYLIEGRGRCFAIDRLPEEFYKEYYDPSQLIGVTVKINGVSYEVAGVEKFMINCTPNYPYRLSCGVLVKEP